MDQRDQKLYKITDVGRGKCDVFEGNRRIANSIFWIRELSQAILRDYFGPEYGKTNSENREIINGFNHMLGGLRYGSNNLVGSVICGLFIKEFVKHRYHG